MRQKFLIMKSDEKDELIIREFAELDQRIYSLISENAYDKEAIESAIAKNEEALISTLRTNNMYPFRLYAETIAEAISNLYRSAGNESIELFFDDIEYIKKTEELKIVEEVEKEAVEIDELLEDNFEEFVDSEDITNIATSIKVAEDDALDPDDEG